MRIQRKYQRFIIIGRLGLQIHVENFGEVRLVNFALGGCGFFAEKEYFTHDGDRVKCEFSWPTICPKKITIVGTLRYCVEVKYSPDPKFRYFGLEFDEKDHEVVQPFIEALKQLEDINLELTGQSPMVSSKESMVSEND